MLNIIYVDDALKKTTVYWRFDEGCEGCKNNARSKRLSVSYDDQEH